MGGEIGGGRWYALTLCDTGVPIAYHIGSRCGRMNIRASPISGGMIRLKIGPCRSRRLTHLRCATRAAGELSCLVSARLKVRGFDSALMAGGLLAGGSNIGTDRGEAGRGRRGSRYITLPV